MSLYTYSLTYQHHIKILKQTIKSLSLQHKIQYAYFSQRCYQIILSYFSMTQLFGFGLRKVYNSKSITSQLKVQKILVITNIVKEQIQEIEEYGYNFQNIYLVTLQITNKKQAQLLKNFTYKQEIKIIKQINLNFYTFLDGAYMISKITMQKNKQKLQQQSKNNKNKKHQKIKQEQEQNRIQEYISNNKILSYRSFLLSYSKFYQFQLHFLKTEDKQYNKFIKRLQNDLKQSIQTINRHNQQFKNYDLASSPKIAVLILNRNVIKDHISPLINDFYYGPICQQIIENDKLNYNFKTVKGKMYHSLFHKDLDQAAIYMKAITNDKTVLQGSFQANYFHKAKKAIAQLKDPSPLQIVFHISCWNEGISYAQSHQKTSILHQDIANRIYNYDQKMSNGDILKSIYKWMIQSDPKIVTQQQYIKIAMLTQMTSDMWFYRKNKLRKIIQEKYQSKYQRFLQNKNNIPIHQLRQKPQQSKQQKKLLYRHFPNLVSICQTWIKQLTASNKQKSNLFEKISINNEILKKRELKLVILIDGFVGYNQLALLKRTFHHITQKEINIVCESFCTSQQYMNYLTREKNI